MDALFSVIEWTLAIVIGIPVSFLIFVCAFSLAGVVAVLCLGAIALPLACIYDAICYGAKRISCICNKSVECTASSA